MAIWGELAERLARRYDVLMFDPLGVGESSDIPWLHSTRDMARDACELLDALDVPRAHVFGISLGGMVATWMAIDEPDRVDHLVLASTLARRGVVSRRIFRHAAGALVRAMPYGVERVEIAMLHEVVTRRFRREHGERMREIERSIGETPTKSANLLRIVLAATLHHADADVAKLRAKTLLVFGAEDPLLGRRSRAELEREIPNARVVILEGAGHDLGIERPRELADAILAFLP